MGLEQKLNLRLSQRLVMTPSLQQAIKLLQMSKLELEEVLNQEMVENPILEEEQEDAAAEAEAERVEAVAKEEAAPAPAEAPGEAPAEKERDSFDEIDFDSYFEDYLDSSYNPRQYEETEQVPLENILSRPPGLQEYLSWQISMSDASPEIREIGTYLIGNIDEDGYLRVTRDEIRAGGYENDEDVEKALAMVRAFDPPGICAFDLPDCLRLQIRALGIENPLIDKVITEHWSEFLNRQFPQLARSVGVGMSEIQAVVEVIKNLEPKPGRKYSNERTIYVEPDVAVRKIGDEYVIQLNEDGLPKLRISSSYRKMLRGGNGAIGEEAATYLKDKMRSAVWLIKSLDQRQRTIYKVADSIVRHQRGFLDHGIEHLRPLVLRDVANDIGMHESTVSRVVSNKYIHTPRGLFPMKYFFHSGIDSTTGNDVSSVSIKNKISRLIADEDAKRPHSDARIMQRLRAEGIQIARRTVAKYREELRIPSSSQRKQTF
ncbi:MAG: RNA polymerase factor sigma-54 [Acidobacteria bacterium]|nr:RNA polymerase factor sigma-54 [Acidobacteriota bacterium]MCA1611272.1 RNA polymerase factor sigma-54 [Acidobacteriota bacterium]